ncbi:MAG TPA: M20 family metallopeptidase [Pseudacidobacterium sp.]|jgi:glutamate carboxypeptidase|nr:M20 family metallopeptidase [Pseudacidobacterium sp.]
MLEQKDSYQADTLLSAVLQHQQGSLDLLRKMVEIESPSDDKVSVDQCVDFVAKYSKSLGGRVRIHKQKAFGDLFEARFGPVKSKQKPVLLLGHLDTVWPLGTLPGMPFRVAKGRVWGPGVLDMKAGVAMAFTAIATLQEQNRLKRPVAMLLNSDEEVGSTVSRPVTEKLAQQCEAVYVLEPAQGLAGAYKTARKGVANYLVRVKGVAAHSGVDFESGHSAIAELARQVERVTGFTDLHRGITVNVGTIQGGTRSNVIAAEAQAEVDVRIAKAKDAVRIEKHFRSLRVFDNKCSLHVEGGLNRPPMERTRETVALYKRAAAHARALGFELTEASTGGGSDGNFTSALGVPTLDGMGAVGEGAHAVHESILLEHLAPRTALLAAMLE